MLTDKKIIGKLEKIEKRYEELRFVRAVEVPVQIGQTRQHFRSEPADLDWRPCPAGTGWGGNWITAWFRGDAVLPPECGGRRVFVRARTGGEHLVWVDGQARGCHAVELLTLQGQAGRRHHLAFEAYAGHGYPGAMPDDTWSEVEEGSRRFEGVEVVLQREEVTGFVYDLRVLRQVMHALEEHSLRRHRVLAGLARVFALVDAIPSERPEAEWLPKLIEARAVMRPLLEATNGSSAPWFALVGHSHIDTAWLWSLEESWRKCARTFSSVLNLMEQYPEFLFLQSAPCHAWMVRQEYPEIFARIQARVAEGRWEPNGAMWVEPDTNLPSGESLVRQLLLGQQATREMFGYTADTLWMPDVFGYSASLPQLLRQSGVEYFCTTKINWNDTTRFPYDTFVWKGIDGSPVVAHYHTIHCWPEPEALTAQWQAVQHKDVDDRRLCPYGFGDGGGGPMAEMVEVARRVGNLEGCPRTRHLHLGEFMRGIRDQVEGLPEYRGELYLELHRGTLTSVARIKRGNRTSEWALREAEFLCTHAALRGHDYPRARLTESWRRLLTRQFHDILPGSSIAEVNDEAIATFAGCQEEAGALGRSACAALAGSGPAAADRVLVVNSLSWDRVAEMELRGVPEGMRPADRGVSAQWIEGVDGERRLAVAGVTVPALGGVVLRLEKGEPQGQGPFGLAGDRIETPHAVVEFDLEGRVRSFVDRASDRQLVPQGGALNGLLLGEDIPEVWDNWDIDRDQRLKMGLDGALVRREVVARGPLQLRLRSEYRLGRSSRLVQDMVFHAGTARIDFDSRLEWAEKRHLLKAVFDLDLLADNARHEIQYGHLERPAHANLPQDRARFEVCCHKWTDLSENGFGVALLNDCKYGISAQGGRLGLTLIKSGVHPDPRGDEGTHLFTYSLLPHAGGFAVESVVRPAYELNQAPTVCPAADAADLPGLAVVDAVSVIVESVKWAEQGHAFVLRLYEAGRTGTRCRVRFGVPVRAVSQTNLLEEEARPLALRDRAVELSLRAFEVATLRVEV